MKQATQAYVLVGPTAIGKTAVAEWIARRMNLCLLSADSMLVYREMDIGTAKPTPDALARFRYLGVNLVDPCRDFSAGEYVACVRSQMAGVASLLVVGGTGLYVSALTQGLRSAPPADAHWRAEAESILAARGIEGLRAEAERRAPGGVQQLADPSNPRRLIRMVELVSAGNFRRTFQRAAAPPVVGLHMVAADLERRIRSRVESMFAAGLIDEVKRLKAKWQHFSKTALQAIGYAEILTLLDDRCTVNEAKEKMVIRTRQLAKRQMTWFRRQANVDWLEVTPNDSVPEIADRVQERWNTRGPIALAI